MPYKIVHDLSCHPIAVVFVISVVVGVVVVFLPAVVAVVVFAIVIDKQISNLY